MATYFAHNFQPGSLATHFRKHALEFGPITQRGYLQRARSFLNRAATGSNQEGYRGIGWGTFLGDRVRFDAVTHEFGIVTQDGYIRTYFRPDPAVHGYPTNYDYYLSQF